MAKKNKKSMKEQKNDILLALGVAALAGTAAWMSAKIEQIKAETAAKKAAAAVKIDFTEAELDSWMAEDESDGL